MTTIVWFRQDLRVADNAALTAAAQRGPVLPIFILDDEARPERWRIGGAGKWWLHHSLVALTRRLPGLIVLRGDPLEVIPRLVTKSKADAVYWTRAYEPWAVEQDGQLMSNLKKRGVDAQSFSGSLLHEPDDVTSSTGRPFAVYSAYWRAAQKVATRKPLAVPNVEFAHAGGRGEPRKDWGLLPTRPNWAKGWENFWQPGEDGAHSRLDAFVSRSVTDYDELRNRLDLEHTSRLSPHLHWGEISPRQILARLERAQELENRGPDKFLSELGWREFSYHVLFHNPDFADKPYRKEFAAYPFRTDQRALVAWQQGNTGYPIVDAGMRQLWQTGWMHNRARMVTASFLVKHLRIDWRAGESWFWDTLVDADLADNSMGWQWVAGSGMDAAPYFRIFNPVTQGQRFDPEGAYVRQWCPELAKLPTSDIHAPFDAPPALLAAAGVELGITYPRPIVDHKQARAAALEGFEKVKTASTRTR